MLWICVVWRGSVAVFLNCNSVFFYLINAVLHLILDVSSSVHCLFLGQVWLCSMILISFPVSISFPITLHFSTFITWQITVAYTHYYCPVWSIWVLVCTPSVRLASRSMHILPARVTEMTYALRDSRNTCPNHWAGSSSGYSCIPLSLR